MGGRGTFASGNPVPYTYETIGKIDDVKILHGIGDKHDLPVEAHSSNAYIQLYPDGNFKMLRLFEYPIHDDFRKRTTRLMTEEEYEKYKKYFGGIDRWKPEK